MYKFGTGIQIREKVSENLRKMKKILKKFGRIWKEWNFGIKFFFKGKRERKFERKLEEASKFSIFFLRDPRKKSKPHQPISTPKELKAENYSSWTLKGQFANIFRMIFARYLFYKFFYKNILYVWRFCVVQKQFDLNIAFERF